MNSVRILQDRALQAARLIDKLKIEVGSLKGSVTSLAQYDLELVNLQKENSSITKCLEEYKKGLLFKQTKDVDASTENLNPTSSDDQTKTDKKGKKAAKKQGETSPDEKDIHIGR